MLIVKIDHMNKLIVYAASVINVSSDMIPFVALAR